MADSRPLTDEEVNMFVRLLIIVGVGTTYKAYGNRMFMLLCIPGSLPSDDRSLVALAIEESLRSTTARLGATPCERRHHGRRR